nr:hypothetical transcript [Hymenolepis microstoma]
MNNYPGDFNSDPDATTIASTPSPSEHDERSHLDSELEKTLMAMNKATAEALVHCVKVLKKSLTPLADSHTTSDLYLDLDGVALSVGSGGEDDSLSRVHLGSQKYLISYVMVGCTYASTLTSISLPIQGGCEKSTISYASGVEEHEYASRPPSSLMLRFTAELWTGS